VTCPPVGLDVVLDDGGLEGLILGLATGTGVGSRSKRSVLTTPGCVLLSPSSTWFSSIDSSQSRLGEDLLSLIVVASRGVGEFGGEVIGGVGVLLRKVGVILCVLSEVGNKVVELVPLLMRELSEGWTRSDLVGWVGMVWGKLVVLLAGRLGSKEVVVTGLVV